VTGAIADWNYSDLMSQKVDFGYTNPTRNDQLSGDRVKFTTKDGKGVTPLDVEYPAGIQPRDDTVFLATTLEELILCFPENRINVEVKQEGELGMKCVKAILALVEKYNAWDRVVLASFHEELYDEYQRLQAAGEVPEAFMYSPAYDAVTEFVILHYLRLDLFFDDGMCVFQLPTEEYGIPLATQWLVDTAHSHNMAVHYWTINDPAEMRQLIEIGADGIMTDYPHLLQEVYESCGE
jgi:glycerophosphoryl diester phosphodiesterase